MSKTVGLSLLRLWTGDPKPSSELKDVKDAAVVSTRILSDSHSDDQDAFGRSACTATVPLANTQHVLAKGTIATSCCCLGLAPTGMSGYWHSSHSQLMLTLTAKLMAGAVRGGQTKRLALGGID